MPVPPLGTIIFLKENVWALISKAHSETTLLHFIGTTMPLYYIINYVYYQIL